MEQMTSLLAQYGLLLVFANVLLTQAGLPLPALPMLIVAGALVHDGQLPLAPVVLAAVAGSLIGDLPLLPNGRSADCSFAPCAWHASRRTNSRL